MRRNVSAPDRAYPRRITLRRWRVRTYETQWWLVAQAQCARLASWRDCKNKRCRLKPQCLFPQPWMPCARRCAISSRSDRAGTPTVCGGFDFGTAGECSSSRSMPMAVQDKDLPHALDAPYSAGVAANASSCGVVSAGARAG